MKTSPKTRAAVLTTIGVGIASVVFSQVRSITEVENALKSEGLTEHRASELLAASVPIGGVIPCFGNLALPPNWQVCDGSDLRPGANATLKLQLRGKTPDLRRKFLYGASTTNEIAETGGLSETTVNLGSTAPGGDHSHEVPHSHPLPSQTGPVSRTPPPPNAFVAIWGAPSEVGGAHFQTDRSSNDPEGQHLHELGGSTGGSNPTTSRHESHSHEMGTIKIPTLPPFVQCSFAMRIY